MTRTVALDDWQIVQIARASALLLRDGHPDEASLLAMIAKTAAFVCEPDESGGLAEVYDLDPYSRKVGA